MEWSDASFIRGWYSERTRGFGTDCEGLGFNRRASQERRFEALARLGRFEGARVLDVGCGFGDFFAWLNARGIRLRYHGIDICPEMITECRRRLADGGATFEVADVLGWEPSGRFDLVVASGIFGLLSENVADRIAPTLQRLFSWCRTGVAVNFLSRVSPRPAEGRFYADPADILKLGLALTPAVRLDHDYLPNDFTLYLYAEYPWTQTANPAGGGSLR